MKATKEQFDKFQEDLKDLINIHKLTLDPRAVSFTLITHGTSIACQCAPSVKQANNLIKIAVKLGLPGADPDKIMEEMKNE